MIGPQKYMGDGTTQDSRAAFINRRIGQLESDPTAIRAALKELFSAGPLQPRLQLIAQLCADEVNKCDAHALLRLIHEATGVIFADRAREEADDKGYVERAAWLLL